MANDINVAIGTDEIKVVVEGGQVAANFVAADVPFYLNGNGGNTYLNYNSTSCRLELYVNGSKVKEWS